MWLSAGDVFVSDFNVHVLKRAKKDSGCVPESRDFSNLNMFSVFLQNESSKSMRCCHTAKLPCERSRDGFTIGYVFSADEDECEHRVH